MRKGVRSYILSSRLLDKLTFVPKMKMTVLLMLSLKHKHIVSESCFLLLHCKIKGDFQKYLVPSNVRRNANLGVSTFIAI